MACCSSCAGGGSCGVSSMTMGAIGDVYSAQECEQNVRVWSDDAVEAMKGRADPYFEATDRAVHACTGLDPLEREAWGLFIGQWRTWRHQKSSWYSSAGADAMTTCAYVRSLDGWRTKLAGFGCKLPGGSIAPTPSPQEQFLSMVRWLGIGAVVVVGGVALVAVLPEIRRFARR